MVKLPTYDNKENAMESLGSSNKIIFVMSKKEMLEWKIEHKFSLQPIDILT
jgi:hypothetical protein